MLIKAVQTAIQTVRDQASKHPRIAIGLAVGAAAALAPTIIHCIIPAEICAGYWTRTCTPMPTFCTPFMNYTTAALSTLTLGTVAALRRFCIQKKNGAPAVVTRVPSVRAPLPANPFEADQKVTETTPNPLDMDTKEAIAMLQTGTFGETAKGWLKEHNAPLLRFPFILLLNQIRKSSSYEEFCQHPFCYFGQIPTDFTKELYKEIKTADISHLDTAFFGMDDTFDIREPNIPSLKKLYYLHQRNRLKQEDIDRISAIILENSEKGKRLEEQYKNKPEEQLAREIREILDAPRNTGGTIMTDPESDARLARIVRAPNFETVDPEAKKYLLHKASDRGCPLTVQAVLQKMTFDAETLGNAFFHSAVHLDNEAVTAIAKATNGNKIGIDNLIKALHVASQTHGFFNRNVKPQAQIAIIETILTHPEFDKLEASRKKTFLDQALLRQSPSGRDPNVYACLTVARTALEGLK